MERNIKDDGAPQTDTRQWESEPPGPAAQYDQREQPEKPEQLGAPVRMEGVQWVEDLRVSVDHETPFFHIPTILSTGPDTPGPGSPCS